MSRPGFVVLHGNRLEDLRELLVEHVRAHPPPPLGEDLILVQSNGMRHWLELGLADDRGGLGICAGVRMELPAAFLWQAARAVLGEAAVPRRLPLDEEPLVWRLMRLLPHLPPDADFDLLRRYLQGDTDGLRRYRLAVQLADVFDGYQGYRADWLADWARGGAPALAQDRWQARLWRALLRMPAGALAAADFDAVWAVDDRKSPTASYQNESFDRIAPRSRADIYAELTHRLRAWPAGQALPPGLPPRLFVFGISSMPMQQVELLATLGEICEVLLLAQNPSRQAWDHLQGQRQRLAATGRPGQDRDDLHLDGHPLLAAWGQQGRDYLHLLDRFDEHERHRDRFSRVELFHDPLQGWPDHASAPVLAQIQAGILDLEAPGAAPRPLAPGDDSLGFAICHGPQREVEVLHDRLLAWFNAPGSRLQARDVVVMVPDMAEFAPRVDAVFGRFPPGDARHIPYAVADRSPRDQPLARALEQLLRLPESRFTLAEGLALLQVDAVRARMGLDATEAAQLAAWLQDAGVRWAFDAAHRASLGLAAPEGDAWQDRDLNTWRFGLSRLLLGYATGAGTGDELWQGMLPYPGVGGLSARALGALADWLDALDSTRAQLAQARRPAEWQALLTALCARFLAPADEAEERLLARLVEPLDAWAQDCASAGFDEAVALAVVREHWLARVEAPRQRQRFFGGGVQFATLMPMRTIPFRVVCLLGMQDGAYPRPGQPRDFDLMARPGEYRAGDRSRREDDRYLFLEALLAARDKFYLSWSGRRATDHAEVPPSVLVAQLLDHLRQGWAGAPEPVLQPLQAFSRRYFEQGGGFRSYAADWAAALQGAAAGAALAPMPAPRADLTLADLQRLLRQPCEVYWHDGLHARLIDPGDALDDDEPFALDAWELHRDTAALLRAPVGQEARALAALRAGGQLPLASVGAGLREEMMRSAAVVRERAARWLAEWPDTCDPIPLALDLGGARLAGLLEGWRARPDEATLLHLTPRPGALIQKRMLRADPLAPLWPAHLALCALGRPARTVIAGLNASIGLDPVDPAEARELLAQLAVRWRAAVLAPPPVACRTALAWLQAGDDDKRHGAAETAFEGGGPMPGERERSSALARLWDGYADIAAALPDWAEALYAPLLRHARVIDAGPPDDEP